MKAKPKCSHKIGETFQMPLGEMEKIYHRATQPGVLLMGGQNYRDPTVPDPERDELAKSLHSPGQLHPVLVFWRDGEGYRIAAGFRRIAAMLAGRSKYGFRSIECKRIGSDNPDLVKLVENFERKDPSSFETAQYMHALTTGEHGPKRNSNEIAAALGRSPSHVRNLTRFYRALPEPIREAWRLDRDKRFTFSVLMEIASLAKESEAEAIAAVGRLLAVPSSRPAAPPAPAPVAEARATVVPSPETNESPQAEEPTSSEVPAAEEPPRIRRLGRTGARKLAARLEAHTDALLGESPLSQKARLAYDLLRAIAGEVPAARVTELVEELVAELGPVAAHEAAA